MRSTWKSTILAGCAAAALLTGAARAAEINLAMEKSPVGLDPHISTAFETFQVINGILYEGLTAVTPSLAVEPALATAWTISPDGKTYTFKLRPSVVFHDGKPMEAADVVSSFQRVKAAAIGSPLASRLAAVDTVTAVDAATVEMKLSAPSGALLSSLANIAIVPRGHEADKETLGKAPIGTGPFKFADWKPNGYIQLAKFDKYWDAGLPKVDGLKFNIVPESTARLVGLGNGTYQVLPAIDPASALTLQGQPNVKLEQALELAYTMIGINTSRPPLDNPKVRFAINQALDRPEIIAGALFGAGVPGGPLSPSLKTWALDVSAFPCYKPNVDAAKAALKEAGVATPLKLSIIALPRQDIKDIAQVAQQQLKKIGIELEIKPVELGQFIQDWKNSNFDLFASSNAGAPDPDDYFYRTFRSDGSTNVFKFKSAAVDKLLDDGRAELDAAKRKADYDALQKQLACEGPIAHLAYSTLVTATSTKLTGFEINPNRSLRALRSATLKP
jgi:peptide/nickel transport system substrate-binding protein